MVKKTPTPLFDQALADRMESEAPLAARMRPRTLDEFVGQEHIIGPGRLLRRAIQADQLSSLIFYGPPGTGKTTLARIIANTTRGHFIAINAVLAGVRDIRAAIEEAQERRRLHDQRTILFVDEVHRFNKAQQDALLPWVENGTVILIGATTENPYFEVNKALVSRSRIFQLKPLTEEDLRKIAHMALTDPERGYGRLHVRIDPEALDHLINVANGDARALLNALELAVETTQPDENGTIHIDMAVAEESIQRRAVLYDKEGDVHFDTISAFIKSLRGSDPDAALYWLARMVYAGEDPRFIFRRMLILAAEDVGLADPNAIAVVTACADAFDRVGLPEGQFHLAQAALYLATAAKSNSVMAYFDALKTVENEHEGEVPTHLKDASRDKKGFGHGAGYVYPHAYRDHWVAQQYLPDNLKGKIFYRPSDQGYEFRIREQVERRREAQLAAMLEGGAAAPPEILTYTPGDKATDRWLQRTLNRVGEHLGRERDRLFAMARVQRHHLVLDLRAGSGLLTWEAVRRAAEGGVWSIAETPQDAQALATFYPNLDPLRRPRILLFSLSNFRSALNTAKAEESESRIGEKTAGLPLASALFDVVLARNAWTRLPAQRDLLSEVYRVLRPGGRLALIQHLPRRGQRLSAFLPRAAFDKATWDALRDAEEALFTDTANSQTAWDVTDLTIALEETGFTVEEQEVMTLEAEVPITRAHVRRWLDATQPHSYMARVALPLSSEGREKLRRAIADLEGKQVTWRSVAFVVGAVKGGEST